MPSTVVHFAFAGLVAAALLGDAFSRRSLAVVFGVVLFADLDVFVGLVIEGTHRAAFHTLLLPAVGAGLLWYELRRRERSWLRTRFGPHAPRVAWVSVLTFAFVAVGLDLVSINGANPLYPLHDQFYQIRGEALVSNQRGFVQTFFELGGPDGDGSGTRRLGSTAQHHVSTGIDPTRGATPANAERIFPIAMAGWQLLLILTSLVVLGSRFWLDRCGDR